VFDSGIKELQQQLLYHLSLEVRKRLKTVVQHFGILPVRVA
jgi:hypothetical protein